MRFRRFIACSVVVLSLVATGTWRTSAQGTLPGRETSAASVASTRSPTRCRSIPRPSSARCRTACAYYVRPNPKPAHRAELRLVVKAGSVLEDDDQQGLAHFVEHMLFEGTKHFPRPGHRGLPAVDGPQHRRRRQRRHELRRNRILARRPDRRAGRDRSRAARARGLGAAARTSIRAASIASAASCCPNGGMHLGAGERTQDKIRRAQLEGSRYADRPPIGKPEIIQNAKRDAAAPLLPRLVPPRSDGRDRRRRRRPRRRSSR